MNVILDLDDLFQACHNGNEELVRSLVQNISMNDLNHADPKNDGNTCLHVAAANGHDDIVKILLEHGSYRSLNLNHQQKSAYSIAAQTKESTRLLFLRSIPTNSLTKCSSRFYEQNANDCFDFVRYEDETNVDEKDFLKEKYSNIQTYRTEEEKQHQIEYSASSKAMCQSRIGRFFVNLFHDDEPLDEKSILDRLSNIFKSISGDDSGDNRKLNDLFDQYLKNGHCIEQLIHLYTLETDFYRTLKKNCLPLALPLFVHLPELKERHFKGRSFRGMLMTHDQFIVYRIAAERPGTILQTRSFSSTSIDRNVAEQFASLKSEKKENKFPVLFVFDFPETCDQAINLSRISNNQPCLSEYEDEQEVLVLPWTLFQVTRIQNPKPDDDLPIVHLTNVVIPKKTLFSTFKWSWVELKNQVKKEKKLVFDCAFQKYNTLNN